MIFPSRTIPLCKAQRNQNAVWPSGRTFSYWMIKPSQESVSDQQPTLIDRAHTQGADFTNSKQILKMHDGLQCSSFYSRTKIRPCAGERVCDLVRVCVRGRKRILRRALPEGAWYQTWLNTLDQQSLSPSIHLCPPSSQLSAVTLFLHGNNHAIGSMGMRERWGIKSTVWQRSIEVQWNKEGESKEAVCVCEGGNCS